MVGGRVPMRTCSDRLRQLLIHVDESSGIPQGDLLEAIADTSCPVGHELHVHVAASHLVQDGPRLKLSPAGQSWLIDHGKPPVDWSAAGPASAPSLRSWQGEALDAWAHHGRQGVVEAVTGTGKSRVGVEAVREALDDDFDVVVVAPTTALVEQWVRTLLNAGITRVLTTLEGTRPTWLRHRVIVGTVQSLYQSPPQRADGKVLIVADECHRYGAAEWSRVLDAGYRRRLGLTATFERNDEGLALLQRYLGGGPVYRIGFPEAIRTNVVARYDVKMLGVDLTAVERLDYDDAEERVRDARVKLLAADFPAEPFGAFMTEVQRAAEGDADPTIEDVARQYLKAFSDRVDVMAGASGKSEAMEVLAPAVGASRGALVFTRRKDAAEDLASILRDGGVEAHPIHSGHTATQRRERLAGLKTGRIQALVAPTVLDEGVDVPDVDLGIVMSGSKSRRQMIQRMGRVLRRKADGRKATFIVVYARGTAEDLSSEDGQAGALDLILESADRVFHLERDGQLLIQREVPVTRRQSTPGEPAVRLLGGVPEPVLQTDVGQPERPESNLPHELRDVDPDRLPMTVKARGEYARAHDLDADAAEKGLREALRVLMTSRRIYRKTSVFDGFALRDDVQELVITPHRFVGYRLYRRPATPTLDPQASAGDGERSMAAMPDEEVVVLDSLVPATILFTGDALEQVCDVFELGELRMSDALREARSTFERDLGTGPTVIEQPDGYAVRCLLATWRVDRDIAHVVGVVATRPEIETHVSDAAQVRSSPMPDRPSDVTVDGERPAESPVAAVDVIDQLERLAALRVKGLLTEEEFAAAKAKVLA